MKNIFILFSICILSTYHVFCQNDVGYKVTDFSTAATRHLKISGTESSVFIASLFTRFPETKRKDYTWKFKNVLIPGIEKPLTLQVHQGITGIEKKVVDDSTSSCSYTYFHTFMNDENKAKLLTEKKPSEQDAILIYIKRGRKKVIKTKEELKLVEEYILSLYPKNS